MASRIKLLPDVLIDKIAAGEVIERPASVVKELVENSLDASSTRIRVAIEGGGLDLIEINDNGGGMTDEDLRLAICRHATSKLATPEDLFNIRSFGFRGEALPSITSVSHCSIKSRPGDRSSGFRLEISGGEVTDASEVGCDFGTTITVRNLFFNTPARRKFLRSISSEVRRVIEVVESLAVGNHACAFTLDSDNQRLVDLAAAPDRIARAQQMFGQDLADKFVRGERGSDQVHVAIYLSKPEACRRNRSRIMILVNDRRIESKSLFAAITSAYGEFLSGGLYPQGAVFVTIDPGLVDVNVHPAKSEVRFADERTIFHMIYSLVRESLLGGDLVPGFGHPSRRRGEDFSGYNPTANARQSIEGFFSKHSHDPIKAQESLAALFSAPESDSAESAATTQSPSHKGEPVVAPAPLTIERRPELPRGETRFQQLGLLYIVAITGDGLMIIDQHAAHERVLYELALRAFQLHTISSQQLLFPIPIHLEPADLFVFQRERESLLALGFSVAEFGPRHIQLESVPAVLGGKNPEKLFRELLEDFSELKGDEQKRFHKKAASFACRGAVMAGDRLTDAAMRALFDNLMIAENPYVCPHGRPTMIRLSKHELDLKFGRLG